MDGLLHAIFRLRLERDVCCPSERHSYCPFFGPSISPLSTFCGLFMPKSGELGPTVGVMRAERGLGLLVGPRAMCQAYEGVRLLRFDFEGPLSAPWSGVLLSFSYAGRLRRKRPEVLFNIRPIAGSPLQVGLIPYCPARISPLARPVKASVDTVAPSTPMPPSPVPVQFIASPAAWNAAVFKKHAVCYPFPDVAALAISATSPEGMPLIFAGDRRKCVLRPNLPLLPAQVEKIRSHCHDEKKAGRMAGPFSECPFPNEWCPHQPRIVPVGVVPKDKWDEKSDRVRVICHLSICEPSSVNDLLYSPKLLSFHCQARHFRDAFFVLGPKPQTVLPSHLLD
jgi:hypothetical protein